MLKYHFPDQNNYNKTLPINLAKYFLCSYNKALVMKSNFFIVYASLNSVFTANFDICNNNKY